MCSNPECVALGECGLDFNRNFSPPEVQLEAFEKQVELACRLKKPLFLHERDAHDEMISVLKKYESQLPPSVIHCFTGNMTQVQDYLNLGLYIGITGWYSGLFFTTHSILSIYIVLFDCIGYVWKDKSEQGIRKILTENVIPLDRLLVESDAPFMYPNTRSAKLPGGSKDIISSR